MVTKARMVYEQKSAPRKENPTKKGEKIGGGFPRDIWGKHPGSTIRGEKERKAGGSGKRESLGRRKVYRRKPANKSRRGKSSKYKPQHITEKKSQQREDIEGKGGDLGQTA